VETFGNDLSYVSKDELIKIDGIGPKIAESVMKKFGKDEFARFEP
jgi:helicase